MNLSCLLTVTGHFYDMGSQRQEDIRCHRQAGPCWMGVQEDCQSTAIMPPSHLQVFKHGNMRFAFAPTPPCSSFDYFPPHTNRSGK